VRKSFTAAIAAALMGLGVSSVMASSTPIAAVYEAAPVLATASSPIGAVYSDPTSGSELAGLVHAYELGVTSISGSISDLGRDIVNDAANYGDLFTGDQAYGLVRMGQFGLALSATATYAPGATTYTDPTAVVQYYYGTVVGSANFDATAKNVVSPTDDLADPDTYGLYHLSYHVLATNILGATYGGGAGGVWGEDLRIALGNLDTTASDALSEGSGDVGTVESLAISLWALKTAGYSDAATVGGTLDTDHQFGGLSLAALKGILIAQITNDSFYQRLDHSGADPAVAGFNGYDYAYGYAEDLAYGILALEAFNNPLDAALIASLKLKLAQAVGTDGAGYVPLNVWEDAGNVENAQYSGAALQALPEPATLSLLGLGGMALLARRRRVA